MSEWQQAQTRRVGEAIKTLRGDRSAQWISDVTDELGLRISRSTITDIEIGRRKYVGVHELSLIAAALGVSPAVLLTYGTVPDGDIEVLPGRVIDGLTACDWWGGTPITRFLPAAAGLPADHAVTADLVKLSHERDRLRTALMPSMVGGMGDIDPGMASALREKLAGVIARIRELGGVIRDG